MANGQQLKRIGGLVFYIAAAVMTFYLAPSFAFYDEERAGRGTVLISLLTVAISLAAAGFLLRRLPGPPTR